MSLGFISTSFQWWFTQLFKYFHYATLTNTWTQFSNTVKLIHVTVHVLLSV